MRVTLGSAVILCFGVILVPIALILLLYLPLLGAALGMLSVAAMLVGAVGVVGGR
jgi:hypothetical protein